MCGNRVAPGGLGGDVKRYIVADIVMTVAITT